MSEADEIDGFAWLLSATECDQMRVLARMPEANVAEISERWRRFAHGGQLPDETDWRIWMILAGRGYGKTRAGAEWINHLARGGRDLRLALVGATIDEAAKVMVEGESGILATVWRDETRPAWNRARGELRFASGALAQLYSAERPDKLRGPQHHFAWCDELAKWRNPDTTWDNLLFGLRLGDAPQIMVTTTPKPVAIVRRVTNLPGAVVKHGASADNKHLPPSVLASLTATYGGTRLGRQELDGELIEDVEGALWTRAMIEGCRAAKEEEPPLAPPARAGGERSGEAPNCPPPRLRGGARGGSSSPLVRTIVAVDPPATETGDACGIVAAGLRADDIGVVLEDASVEHASPEQWARAVAACARRHRADRVIAEANNGGDMVRTVLETHAIGLPVTLVRASRGKSARAEPVAQLYEQGRVRHARPFPVLEDQLCGLLIGGGYAGPGRSPDRADALVWALTALMLGRRGAPKVRVL